MSYRLVSLALLMLGMLAPAQAQHFFGHDDEGPLTSQGLTANSKRGSKFTPSEAGTVDTLCAYMDGMGGATGNQQFRLALYTDNGGVPHTLLVESGDHTITSGSGPFWYCPSVGNVPVTTEPYWIVVHSGPTGGVARNYFHEPANWYGASTDTFADGASPLFGSGSPGNRELTVLAAYTPASELRNAGRLTIGNTPSSGLTANFKRGSSFTLTEPGRLSSMTLYLDGKGGASGQQETRLALYRDSNGVPGTKVGESERLVPGNEFTGFDLGIRGTWITARTWRDRVVLDPGRYWLIVHTGTTSGVLRYFADGIAGNWYGNADNFADGTSATFGAGNTGNGTLSGFISYEPGPFVTRQLGRTTIGTRPTNGLSANFIRGSRFMMQPPDPSMVISGLRAYLDGNGGAAGAQQVRMAVYQVIRDPEFGRLIAVPLVTSSAVAIQAGRAPGWVNFPIADRGFILDVDAEFYIMVHSGGTGGVVRLYGDGAANWFGTNLPFEDTGEFSFSGITSGDTTLSVAATYTVKEE